MESTQMIFIRATRVHLYGNGIVGIEMPVAALSDENANLLHNLFPNLSEQAYKLLNQEVLLSAVHSGPLPQDVNPEVYECGKKEEDNGQSLKKKAKKHPSFSDYAEEKLPPNSY